MRWDVIGVGANCVDLVYRIPVCPEPEGPHAKVRISSHATMCGGQAATTLSTCAAMGLRAAYVGAGGSDGNGRRVRDELARRGIDTAHLVVRDAPNPFAVILIVERTGERIVLWNRDEAFALRPEELPVDAIASARVVHVDDVDQAAAIAAARMGREAGAQVTSDIDRLTERTEDLVSAVTVPIFAEHVPPALTGEPDPERALRSLRRRHAGLLCVTLGARGAMLLDGDRLYSEPGFRVDTVDTTGAGDVFRGAFIRALLRGEAPDAMLRFANAAAALSCTRLGAIGGVPSLEEVERLLRESPARP